MVKVIVGTMGRLPFAHAEGLSTEADFSAYLGVCKRHGIREIDTARIYGAGENERILGDLGASKRFTVDTKLVAKGDGSLARESILQSINDSLQALQVACVDLLYIHRSDPSVPLEETLAAINEAHQQGKFQRFGICHYQPHQVEELVGLCKEKGYVVPCIYQGAYNPVARQAEDELLPTLRRHGMRYYAFGPLASGLLAKTIDQLRGPPEEKGRFASLPIAKEAYLRDDMIGAVEKLHVACKAEGVSVLNATMRWMQHHSALQEDDGFIIGASSVEQLTKNLDGLKGGRLSGRLAAEFEALWAAVRK